MNSRFSKLIIIFFLLIILIFVLKYVFQKFDYHNSNISHVKILNYLPSNSDFTLVSNTKENEIKNFISENLTEKEKKELNIIKEGFLTYLGFDLQKMLSDIYDNEFIISFYENNLNKKDILFIFKIKPNENINNIFNTENNLNQLNKIIEFKRPGKLNFIKYIYQTEGNYIITSTKKSLIKDTLKSLNDNNTISSNKLISNNEQIHQANFFSISKNIISNQDSKDNQIENLITTFNFEKDNIKIKSFLYDVETYPINNIDNLIDTKTIIFSNQISKYEDQFDFLFDQIEQKELFNEISQFINYTKLFITKENDWVFVLSNNSENNISFDKLISLKNFKKEKIDIDNSSFSIFTRDKLELENNNIIYKKEKSIFSLTDNNNKYISNNFDELLNINKFIDIYDLSVSNDISEISNKYSYNDRLFISNIDKNELERYFNFLKNLKIFTNKKLTYSLENININIAQKIPELNERIYLEANLKFN
tara:strand:- start:3355 stop:4794 length:1440 start_codon:yes stop_codon:yes gene_type:complete